VVWANAQVNKKVKLESTIDSVSYCIGISIGNAMKAQKISGLNANLISSGISESLDDMKSLFSVEEAENFLRDYFTKKQQALAGGKLNEAEKFFTENKKQKGVVELPSGLQYIVIEEGNGASPTETSTVKTHYKGMFTDGTVFDSSYERGEPSEFKVNGLIPGFTEALLLMVPGSKWKIFIPPHLGYGEHGSGGAGGIGPNEILIFEIELLEVIYDEGER
jgi:FKBP-type peptidyl-prolyl cis-trans isomerase FklB